VLYPVAEEEFVFTSGGVDWTAWQLDQGGWDAKAETISPDMFILEIQGRTSLFALEAATGENLRDIGFCRSRMTTINGPSQAGRFLVGAAAGPGAPAEAPRTASPCLTADPGPPRRR
jgi:hypothetical protein